MKPVIKWAGGKTQLLDVIKDLIPKDIKKYYEPFVGGGALLLNIEFKKAIINDINHNLIFLYNCIKKNPKKLIAELKKISNNNSSITKDYYLNARREFNSYIANKKRNFRFAALFIYLNKSCFNGLYRVNPRGEFNVPFNNRKNLIFYDENNINNISKFLSKVKITNLDFRQACKYARKGDFIFFDSPYAPLNEDTFDGYTETGFSLKDHKELADLFKKLSARKINCMLTNHDTELVRELYKDFNIKKIEVRRSINSDASKRKGVELIITNY